jgi:hypothetical protein
MQEYALRRGGNQFAEGVFEFADRRSSKVQVIEDYGYWTGLTVEFASQNPQSASYVTSGLPSRRPPKPLNLTTANDQFRKGGLTHTRRTMQMHETAGTQLFLDFSTKLER